MQRKQILGKRFYEVDSERPMVFPSVTTVLGHTTDKSWLFEWRKRLGEKEADKISRNSAGRGTYMHLLLEVYTQQTGASKEEKLKKTFKKIKTLPAYEKMPQHQIDVGRDLFYKIYYTGLLDDIKETHLNEEYTYHICKDFKTIPVGYSGTLDNSHWTYGGLYKVIDFKTSRKPKTELQIQNYKEQISAYAIAVGKRYGIVPDCAEIWIASESSDIAQRFVLSQKDIIDNYKLFEKRVFKFYADHKNEIIKYYKENLN